MIVPLAAPGVFTAAILTFFGIWNDFIFGITLTSSERARPVPAALAFFSGASRFASPRHRRCRVDCRHHSHHHPGSRVPAENRCRPDRWRGEGLIRMATIEIDHLTKQYPNGFKGVNDVSLDIDDGEFVILVGPSGCGKSTLLRMIVGLEDITEGELRIDGKRVNEKAPRDRNLSMVFQNYALYPHLTVFENIAFPLRLKSMPDAEVAQAGPAGRRGPRAR